MATYDENGRPIVPPPGVKVRYIDSDALFKDRGKYYDEPVYVFGDNEFYQEVKTEEKPDGDIKRRF